MIVIDQMVDKSWWIRSMREIILDHGSEFRAHRVHDGEVGMAIQ